jgi:hypothetical protein
MSDRDASEAAARPRLKELVCRRTEARITPEEHARCPYCFGKLDDVRTGRHEAFCGYRPGVDPVHFGFPGDSARDREG